MRYKIWDWIIERVAISPSMTASTRQEYWYCLSGITNHYEEGRMTRTSKIIRLDFTTGIVETKNSIYELQKGEFKGATK